MADPSLITCPSCRQIVGLPHYCAPAPVRTSVRVESTEPRTDTAPKREGRTDRRG